MKYFTTPKGHRVIRGHRSLWPTLWPEKSRWPLRSFWPSLWAQKVTGSLKVAVTYYMTPNVNLMFDLGLDLGYDPKGHGVIRGRDDLLYDPKVNLTFYLDLDLGYDPKGHRVIRGHRSLWHTLWPQKSRWPLWSVWPSFWLQKVTGSLEVALTYFMTSKVTVTFVVGLT